jgi:hypothetical protein
MNSFLQTPAESGSGGWNRYLRPNNRVQSFIFYLLLFICVGVVVAIVYPLSLYSVELREPNTNHKSITENLIVQSVEVGGESTVVTTTVPTSPQLIVDGGHGSVVSSHSNLTNKEWCWSMRNKYHVEPTKTWGQLSKEDIDAWNTDRHCDFVFTAELISQRPLSSCLINTGNISVDDPQSHPNMSPTLPLIAIMAGATTRKIKNPTIENLSLFNYLLPSLIRTLDCGFRYEYYLGYDKGDPFFDNEEVSNCNLMIYLPTAKTKFIYLCKYLQGMVAVRTWFLHNIEIPMEKRGIRFTLRLVRINNTWKKPGPVFIEMARVAYNAGANYFLRVNDDTEMEKNWAKIFTRTIHSLSIPYGVVGPNCGQGNQKILTHDFVHRIHMDIFEMNYYPPDLSDWWMDDWISLVYGQTRTFRAKDTTVIHHIDAHGQRYEVDMSHGNLLADLLVKGRKLIRQYMLKNNADEKILLEFDKDNFRPGFQYRDVPDHVKRRQLIINTRNVTTSR